MSNRLVKIASYWNLWEAELAQEHLAAEGIYVVLGNATVVLWCWWYGNAVGGVTLHVSERDAQRAHDVLLSSRRQTPDEKPRWKCATCGEQADGSWEICWRCGTAVDGTPPVVDEGPEVRTSRADAEGNGRIGVLFLAFLATTGVLVYSDNFYAYMSAWVVLGVCCAWWRWLMEGDREPVEPPDELSEEPHEAEDPAEQSLQRRRHMGEAVALRAWRTAVFAWFCFPPLVFYSAWLVWRLDPKKTPIGRMGTYRRWAAGVISAVVILALGSFLILLLIGLMDLSHGFLRDVWEYFNVLCDNSFHR